MKRAWPDVDVVMPVVNEAEHLEGAVSAILEQRYGGTLRLYVAVGPSVDGTEQLAAQLAANDPRIVVVANPSGTTPAGLNVAITASSAPIVVRVDGHSELSPGYVERAVATLEDTGAANVGGIQRPVGTTATQRAVAAAMASRFGTGGTRFHVGGAPGSVDTVYLGVFRRKALDELDGPFDESLKRNQDYELNIRLRDAGHVVWFDPQLWATYRPRRTLRALARQYFEYGEYKRRVLVRHPRSLKPRQAIPPIACAAVVGGALLGRRWRPALAAPLGYIAALLAAVAVEGRQHRGERLRMAAALVTIHFSWSAGLLSRPRRR